MHQSNGTFKQRLTVTVMVAVLLLPGGGLVQCIDANGHAAVELPHPAGCNGVASPQLVSGNQTTTSALSVADCTDVALASAVAIRQDPQGEQLAGMVLTPSPLYTIPVADLWPSPLSSGGSASDEPVPAEHNHLLRSTVLLI